MATTANGRWPHPQFMENLARFRADQLRQFAGQRVAWNWEGTCIVAAGKDYDEVYQRLQEAGIDSSEVVFDFVDDL
jgi:hypothetical protein